MKGDESTLTLKEYLHKHGIPITPFAVRCGLSFHKVYNILRGGTPTLKTSVIIERYTKGVVTCEKLLPEKLLREIEEEKNDHYS